MTELERAYVRSGRARDVLDEAVVAAVRADQDGHEIEHLNHSVLEAAHELGRALVAIADLREKTSK